MVRRCLWIRGHFGRKHIGDGARPKFVVNIAGIEFKSPVGESIFDQSLVATISAAGMRKKDRRVGRLHL